MLRRRIDILARGIESWFRSDPDAFLTQITGVVHVGAHLGQERELYAAHGLHVLWIEPIPHVFAQLEELIAPYPKQRAFCNLIADRDAQDIALHISSNQGASSSIFDLAEHRKLWPDVSFTGSIQLKSVTLATLVANKAVDLSLYDALVMDTQGSELLILKGGIDILPHFRFIKTEVADFESYKGCCQLPEMHRFLQFHGYRRISRHRLAAKRGIGTYFDVVYAARAWPPQPAQASSAPSAKSSSGSRSDTMPR